MAALGKVLWLIAALVFGGRAMAADLENTLYMDVPAGRVVIVAQDIRTAAVGFDVQVRDLSVVEVGRPIQAVRPAPHRLRHRCRGPARRDADTRGVQVTVRNLEELAE